MKINGHGQAKALSSSEIDRLFTWGLTTVRDRALFGICLHTGCRVSEALALTVNDLAGGYLILRKQTTKGKKATRTIPINPQLQQLLDRYLATTELTHYLFPGHHNAKTTKPLTRAAADWILKQACDRVGLVGVSTHSFRRTALTNMSNAGIPLRVIQRISGHSSLATLQRYLEISDRQVIEAVNAIAAKPNSYPRADDASGPLIDF
jgi:integrase/recombinase XerD